MKKNPFLTDSEIRALGVALARGVFDEIGGAAVRKNWLLEEASMTLKDDSLETEEEMYDLESAMRKVEALSGDQVDELIRLVNAHYRIVVNEILYQVAAGNTCICDECRRRAELN